MVLNKVVEDSEIDFMKEDLAGHLEYLGAIHFSDRVRKSDREGKSAYDADPGFVAEIETIKKKLDEKLSKG